MSPQIVLCVDDDPTVLHALRTLLGQSLSDDVRVEVAEGGHEALDLCEDLRAEGYEVGVVITDFIMPSMRGDELLVRLHQNHPQAIKIMLTGQSDVEGIKRSVNEAGLFRFVDKPFDNADLVLITQKALRAYGHGQDIAGAIRALELRNADLEQRLIACTCALQGAAVAAPTPNDDSAS